MRPPAFWDAAPGHPAARLLAPLGALYGRHTAARMDRPGAEAPCPVLCVGNFTLGGAGKTPTALALAALLRALGANPAFLTRGYGGRLAGPVRVDPARQTAAETGDEPRLLARAAPTILARDRPAGAALCVREGADVIVMDDGLQNPSLAKTLSLAVVDAGAGLGNGRPFPAGPLRVPLARQWRHVHGLVLIGTGARGEAVAEAARARGLPVHRARLIPGADLTGRRVLAFAGIGRPGKFFASLEEAGATIAGRRAYPDHHAYDAADEATLAAEAARLGADLVTTEKDHVRLAPPFAARVAVLPVTLAFADEGPLRVRLRSLIGSTPG
ncbi:tetraacyldisaccharide 4'-kinase [Methylobacterium sp. Leaf104]|uniref:tetraacyldisaccharide 4'-kinase n=1 Tax=Methylobacterium TaxID=407 RepID=UPI0006FA35CE|nr:MULTISPECIES: tetraacyldisaccharide 4'-kinase [Methylobacterium]KQP33773.1 tetraacyldisaccharide 4'-kinase [Methylobacterium sp. Leaf104]MCI9879664.1 tetraacyldisaccharide 4'-kinase [Methylobacterium goesingense]